MASCLHQDYNIHAHLPSPCCRYFSAYRIDHVLGFFRIWEIPGDCAVGLLGHFRHSLPLTRQELEAKGIWDFDRFGAVGSVHFQGSHALLCLLRRQCRGWRFQAFVTWIGAVAGARHACQNAQRAINEACFFCHNTISVA